MTNGFLCGGLIRCCSGFGSFNCGSLTYPVFVAAGKFHPASVGSKIVDRSEHLRDDAVEKAAVVAHQNHGAGVVFKRLFKEFERIDVQIVGGFVEHQKVGGQSKKTREQEAIALTARKVGNRNFRAMRSKQEVTEIAHDMLFYAGDFNPFAAGTHGFGHSLGVVELFAQLIEIGDFQIGAESHTAFVRFEFSQKQLDEC